MIDFRSGRPLDRRRSELASGRPWWGFSGPRSLLADGGDDGDARGYDAGADDGCDDGDGASGWWAAFGFVGWPVARSAVVEARLGSRWKQFYGSFGRTWSWTKSLSSSH